MSKCTVALRKESVDRNPDAARLTNTATPSLSARRAWIEIIFDRKAGDEIGCRSPQGERG